MEFVPSVAGNGPAGQLGSSGVSVPASVSDNVEALLPGLGARVDDVSVLRSPEDNLTRWIVRRSVSRTRAVRLVESCAAVLGVPVRYTRAYGPNGPAAPGVGFTVVHPETGHRFVVFARLGEPGTWTRWSAQARLWLRKRAERTPIAWRLVFTEAGR